MPARLQILILDDDRFYSHLTHRLATTSRYTIEECNDPTTLNLQRLSSFDLILLDIMMPGMDGVQMLDCIHQHAPRTGVILMTSLDQNVINSIIDLAAQLEVTVHGVLHKPFKAGQLMTLIDSALAAGTQNLQGSPRPALTRILLQPQISLLNNKWLGCEALSIRQNTIDVTRLPAEESAIRAREFELDMVEHAVTSLQQVSKATNNPLILSLTIPPVVLAMTEFPAMLLGALRKLAFPASYLVLEVQAPRARQTQLLLAANLKLLRQQKIRISLKVTSTSELSCLAENVYDELKIDRSFIANLDRDFVGQELLRSMLEKGSQRCMTAVAEGIANIATFNWLSANGCDIGQGPLIADAGDAAGLIEWYQSGQGGTGRRSSDALWAGQAPIEQQSIKH